MTKSRWSIILSLMIALIVAFELVQQDSQKRSNTSTLAFIEQYMINPNGTFASFLNDFPSIDPNLVAGRESLSESLGIWMQIALLNQDHSRFSQSYELLTNYFLAPRNYIRWKLTAEGQSEVNTNALGDDLRIVRALLNGYDLWQEEKYLTTAGEIADSLQSSLLVQGYFVDFNDFSSGWKPDELSLVYIDVLALEAMDKHDLMDRGVVDKHLNLLRNLPTEGPFYPKLFKVETGEYLFDEEVNLIDQLIVGLHLADFNLPTDSLVAFLKSEIRDKGRLAGRYDRVTARPTVQYESPAVYGLSLLLALEIKDEEWAKELYRRMTALKDQDPAFKGGYVFDGESHMFDNLIPLLAEVSFRQNS